MNECQMCKGCCKFKRDETYFSTLFTEKEIGILKSKGLYKNVFKPFKNSKNVFQVNLIKSKNSGSLLVCPYLDEKKHLCKIYEFRPFDCRFWPFIFMSDMKKQKIFLAHFNKEACQITNKLNEKDFNEFLKNDTKQWIVKGNAIDFIHRYPEFVWDYEPETFIIKEIK